MESRRVLCNIIDVTWRPELAYGIGLITSDGWLHNKTTRVGFISKDKELVLLFCQALKLLQDPRRSSRSGTSGKRYWTVYFKSRQFYDFLLTLGLTPRKSKTLQEIKIPDKVFTDFLRGVFDGDGTFWTHWDPRWPNSFVYHVEVCSASLPFLAWLKNTSSRLISVQGHIKKAAGVYILSYPKGDSRRIFEAMYTPTTTLYLRRKYNKIKAALDFDQELKQGKSTENAVVAQW